MKITKSIYSTHLIKNQCNKLNMRFVGFTEFLSTIRIYYVKNQCIKNEVLH